jgi:dienelactone hydrolase
MARLLIAFLLLMPLSAYAQTEFELPGGNEIRAYFNAPDSGASAPAPLVIIMGGGSGDARIASNTYRSHGEAFADRGWAVAAPVSPNGQSFWGDNAETVRQLIALLKLRDDIADGPVLLMGISNGGISSLEIASNHPGDYLGIIAVPALASSRSQLRALQNFPVYLRIGSEDRLGWGNRFDATVDVLEGVGVRLDAKLLLGRGHTFPLDWDDLEPWLQSLQID